MKIGMVVWNLDVSGGYQKLVLRLSEQLSQMGHEVIIYTLSVDRNTCYPETINKLRIVALYEGDPVINRQFSALKEFRKLARLVDSGLDAIILHDESSLHMLNFYRSEKDNFKAVWMVNNEVPKNFGNLRVHFIERLKSFAGLRSLLTGLPALVSLVQENASLMRALRYVDTIAVYDRSNKELVRRILKRDAVVVYAGADLDEFPSTRTNRAFSANACYRILSIGVLFPHRRYEDLVDATYMLLNDEIRVNTTIVGLHTFCQDYYESLIARVRKLGLDRHIIFEEYVSEQELRPLYDGSDVFVFVNDGFSWGIAVCEAVAAGLPVVITNNIGVADLLEDGKHAWVVPPRSPERIARAIKEIVRDRERTSAITREAFNSIRNIVSWESYARRMVALLEGSSSGQRPCQ